jgi:hypothetical protein
VRGFIEEMPGDNRPERAALNFAICAMETLLSGESRF